MATTPVGTTLGYAAAGDDGTGSYTAVGQIDSLSPGGDTVAIYEVAALSASVSSKIAGRTTPGQMTMDCYYDPGHASANYDELLALKGSTKTWKITFNDFSTGSTLLGDGIVVDVVISSIGDDVVRFSVTIERTEAWTFAVGS